MPHQYKDHSTLVLYGEDETQKGSKHLAICQDATEFGRTTNTYKFPIINNLSPDGISKNHPKLGKTTTPQKILKFTIFIIESVSHAWGNYQRHYEPLWRG